MMRKGEAMETEPRMTNLKRIWAAALSLALAGLVLGPPAWGEEAKAKAATNIVRPADDLPAPLARRAPATVRVDLEATEVDGALADGTSYTYWTYNGKVPGPFLRARVGDTIEVRLKHAEGHSASHAEHATHSIDLHAATGPGGGGVLTQAGPGATAGFAFRALNPGLYVYHCASPVIAQHIANGMYGLILIEPEEGLAPVDREFYVMQGEIYSKEPFGSQGKLAFSLDKLRNERPEYFVFNGAAQALTGDSALRAKTGETVRIFFGVGGPNFISSFHAIGEIFDRAYQLASLKNPLSDVQTVTVPPGGAAIVEFKLDVPGRFLLVDHALSRLERGLVAHLEVDGAENPSVFRSLDPAPGAEKPKSEHGH
jgi:nitrite reductase (NO-forming)